MPLRSSLPKPPGDLNRRELPITAIDMPVFRMYRLENSPDHFGRSSLYRFDAPRGQYGVLYAGADVHCAFIETFGWATGIRIVSMLELRTRGIASITARRPLRLVDLSGDKLAALGADGSVTSGPPRDYPASRRWSQALHRHPSAPDGIFYRARHDPSRFSVALFDRVADELAYTPEGSLAHPARRALLADILDTYGFSL